MNLTILRPTRRAILAMIAALVALFTLCLYASGMLNGVERQTVNERFSWRGDRPAGSQIVIVGIDQKTLKMLNIRPPLPRSDYAKVLDRVRAASPQLIGVDAQFLGRTNPAEDNALLAAVARDGPVLLVTHDGDQGPILVNCV